MHAERLAFLSLCLDIGRNRPAPQKQSSHLISSVTYGKEFFNFLFEEQYKSEPKHTDDQRNVINKAEKSPNLMAYLIEHLCVVGGTVLDLTAGSGSSAVGLAQRKTGFFFTSCSLIIHV